MTEDYCHIHDRQEPGEGAKLCYECGHLYRTWREIWWTALRTEAAMAWNLRRASRTEKLLRGLVHVATRRPSSWRYCPYCSHDF